MVKKVVPAVELRRKAIHILLGITIVCGVHYEYLTVFMLFIILCFGVALSFVLTKYKVPVISKILDLVERKHVHPGKGAITYFIACILSLKLFPQDIALASILVLALGDGVSTVVGIRFGKTKTFLSELKLLEGTVVGMICGGLAASFFVPFSQGMMAAIIAMGIEATEVKMNNKILSDNILVPLAAGTTIMLMRMYL